MKAERRHELKENSLVGSLQQFPLLVKQYQSQIALVLVLIALAVVLVRYRINAAQERLATAQQAMAIASEDLNRLKSTIPSVDTDDELAMKAREEFYSDGLQQADDALQKAPDSQSAMKAQALILKGDLNFEMANFPEFPGAATRPSLRPSETPDTLLSNAFDAYTQVLQNYAAEKFAVTAAHFGLAAVAENRAAAGDVKDTSQWDAAKTQYQAVVDSDASAPFKNLAALRLQLLPQLQRPALIDLPPTTAPTTTMQAATTRR